MSLNTLLLAISVLLGAITIAITALDVRRATNSQREGVLLDWNRPAVDFIGGLVTMSAFVITALSAREGGNAAAYFLAIACWIISLAILVARGLYRRP